MLPKGFNRKRVTVACVIALPIAIIHLISVVRCQKINQHYTFPVVFLHTDNGTKTIVTQNDVMGTSTITVDEFNVHSVLRRKVKFENLENYVYVSVCTCRSKEGSVGLDFRQAMENMIHVTASISFTTESYAMYCQETLGHLVNHQ